MIRYNTPLFSKFVKYLSEEEIFLNKFDNNYKNINLYINYNILLENTVNKIINKQNRSSWCTNEYLNLVENELMNIVNKIKPNNLIYISMDGVVPLPIIYNKRKNAFINISSHKLYTADTYHTTDSLYSNIKFDKNQLLPGTMFTNIVIEFTNNFCKKIGKNIKIIFSDSNSTSSSKQKIFNYIKKNYEKNINHVIYFSDDEILTTSMTIAYDKKNNLNEITHCITDNNDIIYYIKTNDIIEKLYNHFTNILIIYILKIII